MMRLLGKLGTSSLVVAAFVGPGTVLTCAAAGMQFGYDLAWVLIFASFSVFVLQSFTAASGILVGQGLGQSLRTVSSSPLVKGSLTVLVVTGLWVGCAAFQTGNLLGAGAGLDVAFGWGRTVPLLLCAGLATLILLLDLRRITTVLGGLVAAMSILFVSSAWMAGIDWADAFSGLLTPRVPAGSLVPLIALLGTTVVTYNLFLHASASKSYWQGHPPAVAWRRELIGMALFIPLGGLVSLAILATGASVSGDGVPESIAEFAILLEPAAGKASRHLFAAGLLAAGLTSAVTAPLAAAAGITELFAWDRDAYPGRFRMIWISVIATGLFFGLSGINPLRLIVAAQAANGLLLPIIGGVVVYLAAKRPAHRLSTWYLALGVLIILVCAGLGGRTLWWAWNNL